MKSDNMTKGQNSCLKKREWDFEQKLLIFDIPAICSEIWKGSEIFGNHNQKYKVSHQEMEKPCVIIPRVKLMKKVPIKFIWTFE